MSNFDNEFKVVSIPRQQTKEWLIYKHYAKRMPSISYSFGLYHLNELVGVCTYGLPPADNVTLLCGDENKEYVIELNRLIKNDGLPKNIQSWFVSQTFKLLPKPLIVVSYSDPNNGHNGYTYQALNFLFTGFGGSTKEYIFNGKQITTRHVKDYWFKTRKLPFDKERTIDWNFKNVGGQIIEQKPKNRYVIFLGNKRDKKRFMGSLKWDILPYPKGNNSYYDTSHKTVTQQTLF
jgi:hypothetical protein